MSELWTPRQELAENMYLPVAVDIGQSDLSEAIRAYREFLQLPAEFHEATRFRLDERKNTQFGQFERVPGINNKGGEGVPAEDVKDLFHFGALTRQVVEARLQDMPSATRDFLDAAEDIYWASARTCRNAFEQIDDFSVGLVGLHFDERAPLNHHLRFIAYYENDGECLATGHFDRSVGTVHLGTSHRGLRIGTNPSDLQLYEGQADQSLFFLGVGWNALSAYHRAGGSAPLRPMYHDVVQLPEQGIDDKLLRWAVVMFFNPYQLDTTPAEGVTRPKEFIREAALV
jgi:hypothetical protein